MKLILYQLKVVDESGRPFTPESGWYDVEGNDGSMNIIIVPKSDQLVELGEKDIYEPLCRECYNKAMAEEAAKA